MATILIAGNCGNCRFGKFKLGVTTQPNIPSEPVALKCYREGETKDLEVTPQDLCKEHVFKFNARMAGSCEVCAFNNSSYAVTCQMHRTLRLEHYHVCDYFKMRESEKEKLPTYIKD